MNVTILLCGGPMSGKTMLARVLVEMLKEQGFGVAYSEVSVPPVVVGGEVQDVGEVLVVTDHTPPKPVRPVYRKVTDKTPASVSYVQPPDNTADFITGVVVGSILTSPPPPPAYEPTSPPPSYDPGPSTDYSSGSGDFGAGSSGDAGGW